MEILLLSMFPKKLETGYLDKCVGVFRDPAHISQEVEITHTATDRCKNSKANCNITYIYIYIYIYIHTHTYMCIYACSWTGDILGFRESWREQGIEIIKTQIV